MARVTLSKKDSGALQPGLEALERIAKKGLCHMTIEDSIDLDGTEFTFTPMVELTDCGRQVLEQR